MASESKLVAIVAGGTGGHLYPGISVARAIKQGGTPDWEVVFIVRKGDLGKDILQREGFSVAELPGQGLPRNPSVSALQFPFKLTAGFIQAFAFLKQRRPRVVLGMGGYLSFPVLLAARLKGIPTLIHEQNVVPGLANRILAHWVDSTAVSFVESQARFPSSRIWVSGLPIRSEIGSRAPEPGRRELGLAENLTTFFVFGGSQGARRLNRFMVDVWTKLVQRENSFQVLHVTGGADYELIRQAYSQMKIRSIVLPYCHSMASAYAAADLVICRAGASTVAELIVARRPSILVPFPHATDNHQYFNAQVMEKRGWAEIILEKDLLPERMASRLEECLQNSSAALREWQSRFPAENISSMGSAASQKLTDFIKAMPSKLV